MADKLDFKKDLDVYQAKLRDFRIVEVPELRYLMIDGHGDPNVSSAFAQAVEALYPIAYTLKFASKTQFGRDYVVPPLEGLWWSEDIGSFAHIGPYDAETALLAQMHDDFIPSHGLEMVGKHHEIYLSDSRKVSPEKLRTIVRQPVRRSGDQGPPEAAR